MSRRCADCYCACVRFARFVTIYGNAFRVALFHLTHLLIFPLCLGVCCELIGWFSARFPGRLRVPSGTVRSS
jgi:hypothetical protein